MKSLVYTAPEVVEVLENPVPEPKEGQVRIKVKYCGVCGSDIHIFRGTHPRAKAPLILGHEFIGTIDTINGGSGAFQVGDRVAAYPLLSCGHCFACKTGIPHVCQTLKLIGIDCDGGMAEYVCCAENVLFKIPEGVSDRAAVTIEPLAVIVREMHQSGFKPMDNVCIIGAGPIGLLTAMVARKSGADQVIICDYDKARVDMCRKLGFDAVFGREEDLVEHVKKCTNGTGVDIVYECSGAEAAALQTTDLARIQGMICMTATHTAPHKMNLQAINFKEQKVTGTRVYTMREFGQAVELSKLMADDLEKVVTHIVPLSEGYKVFDMIKDPSVNTVKVAVDCSQV